MSYKCLVCTDHKVEARGAVHYATDSGNFGRNSNGKVRFGLVLGEGPDSSDYFRLQRQLKSMPPHPAKTTLTPKKLASPASPTIQNTSPSTSQLIPGSVETTSWN